jgi:hypothetical protein
MRAGRPVRNTNEHTFSPPREATVPMGTESPVQLQLAISLTLSSAS